MSLDDDLESTIKVHKDLITDFCKKNKKYMLNLFYDPKERQKHKNLEDYQKTIPYVDSLRKGNWVLYGEPEPHYEDPELLTWCYDCEPFDNQVRAYIYEKDGLVQKLEVLGE